MSYISTLLTRKLDDVFGEKQAPGTPELTSSSPGTAGLQSCISSSTSYPEL